MNELPRSGVSGVTYEKLTKKWAAKIGVNGKIKYLGSYKDVDTAVLVRYVAEIRYHGNNMYLIESPAAKYLKERRMLR